MVRRGPRSRPVGGRQGSGTTTGAGDTTSAGKMRTGVDSSCGSHSCVSATRTQAYSGGSCTRGRASPPGSTRLRARSSTLCTRSSRAPRCRSTWSSRSWSSLTTHECVPGAPSIPYPSRRRPGRVVHSCKGPNRHGVRATFLGVKCPLHRRPEES